MTILDILLLYNIPRETPKLIPPIYFHGNFNIYWDPSYTLEDREYSATQDTLFQKYYYAFLLAMNNDICTGQTRIIPRPTQSQLPQLKHISRCLWLYLSFGFCKRSAKMDDVNGVQFFILTWRKSVSYHSFCMHFHDRRYFARLPLSRLRRLKTIIFLTFLFNFYRKVRSVQVAGINYGRGLC